VRYAVISDIHGNIDALEVVIADATAEGVDQFICLGDIVGYGGAPNECVDRVRRLTTFVIAGNHDFAVCGKTDLTYFNPYALLAVEWTAEVLEEQHLQYIASLHLMLRKGSTVFVHSSPLDPASWGYILSPLDAKVEFDHFQGRVCFIGHSHIPAVFVERAGVVESQNNFEFSLEDGARYIVNVGSVGQPRDGDPRASYAIYDEGRGIVCVKRVEYNVGLAQKRILSAGLPPVLAHRLAVGK